MGRHGIGLILIAAAAAWIGCNDSSSSGDAGESAPSGAGGAGGAAPFGSGGSGAPVAGLGGPAGAAGIGVVPGGGTGGMAGGGTGGTAGGGAGGMAGGGTGGMAGGGAGGMGGMAGGGVGGMAGTGTGGSGGSSAALCTGKPGAQRGQSMQTVSVGGLSRTFVYYAPDSLDPNQPVPLLIVPHGFTMTGLAMQQITGYNDIADREGFVVAYPDGEMVSSTGGGLVSPWNVGLGICGLGAFVAATGDDQGFMDALISWVEADQCIDQEHVFMSGFSMGGYFSNETGCMNPQIKGIGPHSGGTHDLSSCVNDIMPTIIFHGDADWLISYTCGTDARDKWAEHNGCMPASAGVDTKTVAMGTCEYSKGCPPGGQVALCTFTGMSHCWAGGTNTGTAVGATFGCPGFETASELGWAFFKEYAW